MPDWIEVSDNANAIFNVWTDGSDLRWAEQVWKIIEEGNLLAGDDLVSFTEARMYLATLAVIYHEFCGLAFDNGTPPSASELADELDLDRLSLGILAAEASEDEDWRDSGDDYELFELAAQAVSRSMRPYLYDCLFEFFKSDWAMFHSLYQSQNFTQVIPDEDKIADSGMTENASISPNILMAYQFLDARFTEQ